FGAPERRIKDIQPLEKLTDLKELHLSGNSITELSVLQHLTNLEELYLSENGIEQLPEEIADLEKLRILYLPFNQIEDISLLEGLTKLEALNIEDNEITNFGILANLTELTYLNIDSIPCDEYSVDSLDFLQYLTKLEEAHLTVFENTDETPIQHLGNMKKL